ncbi:MAG: hypothetical protein R3F46_06750 [bacterium]
MAAGRKWTDKEREAVWKLYTKHESNEFTAKNPEIVQVAKEIDRTPASVAMKLGNFLAIDPNSMKDGLSSFSKDDERFVKDKLKKSLL